MAKVVIDQDVLLNMREVIEHLSRCGIGKLKRAPVELALEEMDLSDDEWDRTIKAVDKVLDYKSDIEEDEEDEVVVGDEEE